MTVFIRVGLRRQAKTEGGEKSNSAIRKGGGVKRKGSCAAAK